MEPFLACSRSQKRPRATATAFLNRCGNSVKPAVSRGDSKREKDEDEGNDRQAGARIPLQAAKETLSFFSARSPLNFFSAYQKPEWPQRTKR